MLSPHHFNKVRLVLKNNELVWLAFPLASTCTEQAAAAIWAGFLILSLVQARAFKLISYLYK